MTNQQRIPALPPRVFGVFLETLLDELGLEMIDMMLEKVGVPQDYADPKSSSRLDALSAAERYSAIQHALRTFLGRGARVSLIRIGRMMWERLLDTAPIAEKAQAGVIRSLPVPVRRKTALDLLSRMMRVDAQGMTIHSLDLDLMLVDRSSPTTLDRMNSTPICYVTLGLMQEALYWATGRDHDVEESGCRANGNDDCEFKVNIKGK